MSQRCVPLGVLCLLALHLAGGLVQGIPQDRVLLLQTGQLCVGTIFQLLLKSPDLKSQWDIRVPLGLQREPTFGARLVGSPPTEKTKGSTFST